MTNRFAKRLGAAVLLVLTGGSAHAASAEDLSLVGRYALNANACRVNDIFVTVTDEKIDLPIYSCEGLDFTRAEKRGAATVYRVKARSCIGEEGAAKADAFKLLAEADTIMFLWSDGSRSSRARRCRGAT